MAELYLDARGREYLAEEIGRDITPFLIELGLQQGFPGRVLDENGRSVVGCIAVQSPEGVEFYDRKDFENKFIHHKAYAEVHGEVVMEELPDGVFTQEEPNMAEPSEEDEPVEEVEE